MKIKKDNTSVLLVLEQSFYQGEFISESDEDGQVQWNGACLDRAQRSVIGLRQAMAYCKYSGVKFEPKLNGNSYRFGADKQEPLGSINICFPAMTGAVELNVDMVGADVPFLVGLDTMDVLAITSDTVLNVLKRPKEGCFTPLVWKHGHVFLEWQKERNVFFTKHGLKKMHRSSIPRIRVS
jgi:hypothetical protein